VNLRVTNSTLLALLGFLTLSGAYSIVWPTPAWLYDAHRYAGFGLIALLPWKAGIAWRSLRRGVGPKSDRNIMLGVSLLMATAQLTVLSLAVIWAGNFWPALTILGDTAISWHWMIALGILPFLALHVWRRWPKPKARELVTRRAALRYLGWGAAALAGWQAMGFLARVRQSAEAPRATTGSVEQGSFSGNAMPVTHSLTESAPRLDAATWALSIGGAVSRPTTLTYDAIAARPQSEITATLDCTSGWFCTQHWQGTPLSDYLAEAGLLPEAGAIRLTAASGYVADFPLEEAQSILLATRVGGETLDHWHGFPVRAVAPTRRGWHWVKWVTSVEVRAGPKA